MAHEIEQVPAADAGPVQRPVVALPANALRFLARLRDEGWVGCIDNPPSAAIQGLVDRGYCRLSPALVGPLGLRTGDVMVGLTEAGREALRHNAL